MRIYKTSMILGTFAVVLAFLTGYAVGQRQPPPQNVGQSEELLRTLDLTNELDSAKGRQLRMRKITLQPGALAIHDHVGRPAVTYILEGEGTYHSKARPI